MIVAGADDDARTGEFRTGRAQAADAQAADGQAADGQAADMPYGEGSPYDGPGDGPPANVADGRRLRRDRNRQAVVHALLGLYHEGNLRPSSAEVALRAGLSPRSLFRYFDDVDDLCRAAVDRHIRRILPLNEIGASPGDPVPAKAAALAAQRVRLYEAIGSVGVVSRLQAPFQPLVQDELSRVRQGWRRQIAELFGPEIAALGASGDAMLAAADALCSFESYQLLRHDQGRSPGRVRKVLTASLMVLFGRPGGPP